MGTACCVWIGLKGSSRLIGLLIEYTEILEFCMSDGNFCDIFKILSCVSYKCFCLETAFQSFADPPSPVVAQLVRSHSACGFSGFLSGIAEDSVLGSDVASTFQENICGPIFSGWNVGLFWSFYPRKEGHYVVLKCRQSANQWRNVRVQKNGIL